MSTKAIANIIGWVFIVVGLIGFGANRFLGMELNSTHNLVMILTGMLSVYFGLPTVYESTSRFWCITAGAVLALLGIAGFFCGPGTPMVVDQLPTKQLLVLIPGTLEYATGDHWFHLVTGLAYIVGGLVKTKELKPEAFTKKPEKELAAQR